MISLPKSRTQLLCFYLCIFTVDTPTTVTRVTVVNIMADNETLRSYSSFILHFYTIIVPEILQKYCLAFYLSKLHSKNVGLVPYFT